MLLEFVITMSETNQIELDNIQLLLTPIASNYKKDGACSKKDWEEQLLRCENFEQMMWDDSQYNKSKVNDILAVWRYQRGVTFHRITDIKDPSERLPSWSKNVGQSDRRVLFISREIDFMKWDKWLEVGGPSRCMGTASIKNARDSILCELERNKNKNY